jgi:hypothetical protein
MKNEVPVRFVWGTFCRKAIIDKDTGSMSLIEIIPGLKSSVELHKSENSSEESSQLLIDLGEIDIVSTFEKKANSREELKLELELEAMFPASVGTKITISLFIDADNDYTFFKSHISRLAFPVPMIEGSYPYSVQFCYRFENQEIGKVELPILVSVTALKEELE